MTTRYERWRFTDDTGRTRTAYMANPKFDGEWYTGRETNRYGEDTRQAGPTYRMISRTAMRTTTPMRMNNTYGELEQET